MESYHIIDKLKVKRKIYIYQFISHTETLHKYTETAFLDSFIVVFFF